MKLIGDTERTIRKAIGEMEELPLMYFASDLHFNHFGRNAHGDYASMRFNMPFDLAWLEGHVLKSRHKKRRPFVAAHFITFSIFKPTNNNGFLAFGNEGPQNEDCGKLQLFSTSPAPAVQGAGIDTGESSEQFVRRLEKAGKLSVGDVLLVHDGPWPGNYTLHECETKVKTVG